MYLFKRFFIGYTGVTCGHIKEQWVRSLLRVVVYTKRLAVKIKALGDHCVQEDSSYVPEDYMKPKFTSDTISNMSSVPVHGKYTVL